MARTIVKKLKPVFTDARGEIWDILEGAGADLGAANGEAILAVANSIRDVARTGGNAGLAHIGFITSKSGAVRGNHYHKQATQYTYILRGKAEWLTKDLREPAAEIKSEILSAGDLAITEPEVAHALIALEDTEFLDLTNVSRAEGGYEADTFRIELKK